MDDLIDRSGSRPKRRVEATALEDLTDTLWMRCSCLLPVENSGEKKFEESTYKLVPSKVVKDNHEEVSVKYLISCPVVKHDEEKGVYTVRLVDLKHITQWVSDSRAALGDGTLVEAAAPAKEKKKARKRKAVEVTASTSDEEAEVLQNAAATITRSGRVSKKRTYTD